MIQYNYWQAFIKIWNNNHYDNHNFHTASFQANLKCIPLLLTLQLQSESYQYHIAVLIFAKL